MNETSRYHYEKRIKDLQMENEKLRDYRRVAINIYDAVGDVVAQQKEISRSWILHQFRELFK